MGSGLLVSKQTVSFWQEMPPIIISPVTGLELNTGIGEAHNLTWKLATVLKGPATLSLLKTYEEECQATGKCVMD